MCLKIRIKQHHKHGWNENAAWREAPERGPGLAVQDQGEVVLVGDVHRLRDLGDRKGNGDSAF